MGPLDRPKAKVLDFGLSRFTEVTGNTVTRTGLVMGTPAYMSPEQAKGERADHRVDVYGVGAILYTALTGRAPFNEESPQQTVLAVMSSEAERPRTYAPNMPEELELVVQRAMAREPSDRYQSMAELDAALELFDSYSRLETGARPPRGALMSRVGSSADDVDVSTARTELAMLLVLALVLGLLGLVTTIVGLQNLFWGGRQLSATEFVLVLAVVIGTLITPLVLTIRFIRRRLWNNSVRIVELIPRLRGPLTMALAVYGGITLLGRAFDGFGRALNTPPLAPNLSGWAGWGPILFFIALITGVGMVLRRRLLSGSSNGFLRRLLAGPGVFGTVTLAAVVLIGFGRARSQRPVLAAEPVASPSASSSAAVEPTIPPPDSAAAASSVAPPSSASVIIQRAPTDQVADAISKGAAALAELRKSYPKDPAVLEPLARALGRDPATYKETIDVLGNLFTVAPSRVLDHDLSTLVVKIALGPAESSIQALDLMAQRMGQVGPDLLYDLMLTSQTLRRSARERLDDPDVQSRFSAELENRLRAAHRVQLRGAAPTPGAGSQGRRHSQHCRPALAGDRLQARLRSAQALTLPAALRQASERVPQGCDRHPNAPEGQEEVAGRVTHPKWSL